MSCLLNKYTTATITLRIYAAFEEFPSRETRAVFLDISKAFDKVWHDGLILKLNNYGTSGPLLALIESFLSNRTQRTVLNGKCPEWSIITSGVPQCSVLGPLFFLVYINDLVDDLSSDAKSFTDDTFLSTIVYDENIAAEQLNNDLKLYLNELISRKCSLTQTKQNKWYRLSSRKRGLS